MHLLSKYAVFHENRLYSNVNFISYLPAKIANVYKKETKPNFIDQIIKTIINKPNRKKFTS